MTTNPYSDHCTEVLPLGAPRDEWLAVRRAGIGGSDCSAVMGFRGDYDSPLTVWENKTGRVPDDDLSGREVVMWGNLLEPVIRAEAARRLGLDVYQLGTLRSIERPWQQFNPDGVFSDGGLLECKNTSQWMHRDWDGQVPDHAELQTQHGMAVTGATHAYVAGLVGGNRLVIERIERDDELIALINATESTLWNEHVLTDIEPPADGSTATREALVRRHPVVDDRDAEVDLAVASEIQAEWLAGQAAEKAGKARKKAAENRARQLMDGAARLTHGGIEFARIKGGTFASKRFRDNETDASLFLKKVEVVDTDALKAENPDLYRRYQAQVFEATTTSK
jgi:putative phage-type endonuclease